MKGVQYGPVISITAGEALTQRRFIDFEGKHTVDLPAIGVTLDDVDSSGEASIQCSGIALVESGGAITAGNLVSQDASGRAVALTLATDSAANLAASIVKICGVALDTTTDAGQFLRVALKL